MNSRVYTNRARYNRLAGAYEALVRYGSLGQFSRFYRAVADAIEPAPGALLVDVGCGPGTLTPYLLPKVGATGAVLGTDVSDKMIDRARSQAQQRGWPNARFERSDARDFSPPTPVSVVVFCLSLTTMPEAEDCFSRALRWLEPRGQIVVLDSFPEPDRRLADLVIRIKSPAVGADPGGIGLAHIQAALDSVRVRRFHLGVYTLLSGRKTMSHPVGSAAA